MDPFPFLRGLLLGLAVAAPVGPMSLLCMRRTLTGGFRTGLVSGLGIASADALYSAVAAFGLTAVADFLVAHQFWPRLIGGAFLCYLGVKTFLARPAKTAREAPVGASLAAAYGSMVALTLANPTTILSFIAIFAGMGVAAGGAVALVAGVFAGSALWWLVLVGALRALRTRMTPRILRGANFASGAVITGFGVLALAAAAQLLAS